MDRLWSVEYRYKIASAYRAYCYWNSFAQLQYCFAGPGPVLGALVGVFKFALSIDYLPS